MSIASIWSSSSDARHDPALVPRPHRQEVRRHGPTTPGARSGTASSLRLLVIQFATENPNWGYTRIRGAVGNFDHEVGRNTIKRILAKHGVDPAPRRGKTMPWKTFLKAHFDVVAATDFFTVEVLTLGGLVRYVV